MQVLGWKYSVSKFVPHMLSKTDKAHEYWRIPHLHILFWTRVIVSIKHRGLKRWFYKEDPSGLTPHLVPIIDDILARLHVAEDVKAMSLPG